MESYILQWMDKAKVKGDSEEIAYLIEERGRDRGMQIDRTQTDRQTCLIPFDTRLS